MNPFISGCLGQSGLGFFTLGFVVPALVSSTTTKTQTGYAAIQATTQQTQTGYAYISPFIGTPTAQTQTGYAFIQGYGNIVVSQLPIETVLEDGSTVNIRVSELPIETLIESSSTVDIRVSELPLEILIESPFGVIPNTSITTSDTWTLGWTESASVTTHSITPGSDTWTLGWTESASASGHTVTTISSSDTWALGWTESAVLVTPSGERVDHWTLGWIESATVEPHSSGGGTNPTAIEPTIQLAAPRAKDEFFTSAPLLCNDAITIIHDTCLACGWTVTDTFNALGFLDCAFFVPVAGPVPSARIPAFDDYCVIDSSLFRFYDPRVDSIGADTDPTHIYVLKGVTDGSPTGDALAVQDSLDNLAVAISATSFTASVDISGTQIDLTSTLPGPAGNYHRILGNGNGSVGQNSAFGGYVLTSQQANGNSAISVRVEMGDLWTLMLSFFTPGNQLDYGMEGDLPTGDYRIPSGHAYTFGQFDYKLFVDPYSILITPQFDPAFHGGDIYVFNDSAFFTAPWIDPTQAITYCAYLCLGYGNVRDRLQTVQCAIEINGTVYQPVPSPPGNYGSTILLFNQPTYPLQSWNSDPTVYCDAILALSDGQNPDKIVGYLWNCYCIMDTATRGDTGFVIYKNIVYPNFVMATNGDSLSGPGSIATMYLITA